MSTYKLAIALMITTTLLTITAITAITYNQVNKQPIQYIEYNNTNTTVIEHHYQEITTIQKKWVQHERSKQCLSYNRNNSSVWSIQGNSMNPSLWEGDRVYTTKYKPEIPLVEGDITVSLNTDGTRTIHRVTRTQTECYVTQGDNNEWEDDCREYSSTVAVVCEHSW